MSEKKQVLLRIPQKLWEELNKMADDDLRSVNGEIEYILVQAVKSKSSQKKVIREEIVNVLQENGITISSQKIEKYK